MNPPPPVEIFHGVEGSDVDAVSFYHYEAHLTFENKNRFSFSAPFRFAEEKLLSAAPIFEFPLSETKLVRVLGCQVSKVTLDADGRLSCGSQMVIS
jgi:hypothetical protein